MKKLLKILLAVVILALLVVLGLGTRFIMTAGPVGSGFVAKIMCTCVFLSGRDVEDVWENELAYSKGFKLSAKVDMNEKSITARLPGILKYERKAIYREGLGCTLVIDTTEEELREQGAVDLAPPPAGQENLPWPKGDVLPEGDPPSEVDMAKINAALDDAFNEPNPENPRRTRGVVIVYDGRLIAERYAPGFDEHTPQHGWSMTKSVNSALIGILVGGGKLDIYKPAPVPEWKEAGDPRGAITTDQLLRMSSGLEFLEEYENNPASDTGVMLFVNSDQAAYAAGKPLETAPDTKYSYSTGTSNILARILRHTVGGTDADYLSFPRRELFNKLGMRNTVIELDPSGTFVGGAFMYASPRDWARFGMLFLNDGVWEGERILPEGWVKYSVTPSATVTSVRSYGAQWWLNTSEKGQWLPGLPQDLYSAIGHDGQYVTIIPSRKLVVVRNGFTPWHHHSWDHGKFISDILAAIEN